MSDLISRSELIRVLKDRATNEAIAGYMTAYDVTNSIIDEVDEQPTAYDIDKVVEELNQRKIKLLSYAEDYEKTGDFEQAEIYSQLAIEYTTAIEIVKQGGMGKDVE